MESLVIDKDFWRGRRVFVTGHTGFKGGWLALWLQQLGAEVTGYALPTPTGPSLFESAQVARGMASRDGDIRDLSQLTQAMRAARPEIILHLAAQSLVRAGYADPVNTYQTNLIGTMNVLEAARSVDGLRAIVNVTTDKCYENREWPWGYRETDALGGSDPYSNSKACAELLTQAYRKSFFPPGRHQEHAVALATARAGNVIGGGDWGEDRLVPDVFRAIDGGSRVRIRNPSAVRPWQHVLEPLAGYLQLAERLYRHGIEFGEAWNFGPRSENARTVQWLVDRIVAAWGDGAGWETDATIGPAEARMLKLDCSKSIARLGWLPRLPLPEALEWTVEWHKACRAGSDVRALCSRQIERYEALAES